LKLEEKSFFRNIQWLFPLLIFDVIIPLILAFIFFNGETLEKIGATIAFVVLVIPINILVIRPYKVRLCKIYINNEGITSKVHKKPILNILWADVSDIKYKDIALYKSVIFKGFRITTVYICSTNDNNISFKINNARIQYLQPFISNDNLKQKLVEIKNHINRK